MRNVLNDEWGNVKREWGKRGKVCECGKEWNWSKQLTDEEAKKYTWTNIFGDWKQVIKRPIT